MGHVGGGIVRSGCPTVRRDRLADRQPRHVAEQRRDLPAGPDLDHGQSPATGRQPGPDGLGPGRRALRPDVVPEPIDDDRCGPLHVRRGVGDLVGDRGHAHVDRFRPGVGRDLRVGATQQLVPEDLGDLRLAHAGQPERPADEVRAEAPARSAGMTWSPHIGRISRGGPGRATTTRPSAGRVDQPARRRAVRVGQGRGRWDAPGLLDVGRRERRVTAGPQRPEPGLQLGVHGRCLAHDRGDGFPGEVVGGRPQPTGRDHEVDPLEGVGEGLGHDVQPVGQRRDPPDDHARAGQRRGELAGIRVAGLADGQLRADAQQLGGQDASRRVGWTPRQRSARRDRCEAPVTPGGRRGRRVATRGALSSAGRSQSRRRPSRRPSIVHHGACELSAAGPTPPPASDPPPGGSTPPRRDRGSTPPGLRDQIGATRNAAMALVQAHIELAKAELSVIGGELAKLIGLIVAAIVLVLFAVSLLILGGSLFLGEWLFGSMGWGILHGVLLFVALAIAFVLHRHRHRAPSHRLRVPVVHPRRPGRRRRLRPQPAEPGLRGDRRERRPGDRSGRPAARGRHRARGARRLLRSAPSCGLTSTASGRGWPPSSG